MTFRVRSKARPSTAKSKALVGFARRFLDLSGGYWSGKDRWGVRLLAILLGLLTMGGVVVPILLNLWSERFFDALEQRSMDRFMVMIAAVFGIIAFNIANTLGHLWVKRQLQLGWRQWLTAKILDGWLARGRQHQITYLDGDHDNPDGRIAEDIRIATEYAIDLALSFSYCVLLLVSFTSILWHLSGTVTIDLGTTTIAVPGHLLYIALAYAAMGTTIALIMGRPLVRAANRRQGYEADFRFGLAEVRENAQPIALLHGESGERNRLSALFAGVRQGWHIQTQALSNMMIFSASYSVLTTAFPILVTAPRYISGAITLGVLMQTAQAFQQTVQALSWPIDNLARAAEWKASVERVLGLRDALDQLDREIGGEGTARIVVDRNDQEHTLTFTDVTITEPDGEVVVRPFSIEIAPGERVLITGDPLAAIRLFRALARVWPWGSGRIALPAHTRVFFMPERPYLPRATLRTVLAYPAEAAAVSDVKAVAALNRVGLNHLISQLDEVTAWHEALAVTEKQRLNFARLLVRRPDWIFMENTTDALDPVSEEAMLHLLDEELPKATVMSIGNHDALERHHHRKLILERTNGAVEVLEGTCQRYGAFSDPPV